MDESERVLTNHAVPVQEPSAHEHFLSHEIWSEESLRESRKFHFGRAAFGGVMVGALAVLFQVALRNVEDGRTIAAAWLSPHPLAQWVVMLLGCSTLAGLAAWMTQTYAPEAAGSGIPNVKAVVLGMIPFPWFRILVMKFVGGCVGLAAGLSMGREGPTVHIGAAVGKGLAQNLKLPLRSHRALIAAGAGAGLAAAFNAPLAGFLFVIEEICGEMSPVTYGAALIACVSADAVHRLLLNQFYEFRIPVQSTPALAMLPFAAVLGTLAGLLGVVFNRVLVGTMLYCRKFPWWRAIFIGTVSGAVAIVAPRLSGGGNKTTEALLNGTLAFGVWGLIGLLAGKFLFTCLSYAAGVPGGFFAPLLCMGAILGFVFAHFVHSVTGASLDPTVFAILGMGALFAGSTRALITGTVLIVEMTGNFSLLYATIVAGLCAYLVAEALREVSVYDTLLEEEIKSGPKDREGIFGPALAEVFVEHGSLLDGRQIHDLPELSKSALVSVLRGKNEFVPPQKMHIKAGDVVVFIAETNEPRLIHHLHLLGQA